MFNLTNIAMHIFLCAGTILHIHPLIIGSRQVIAGIKLYNNLIKHLKLCVFHIVNVFAMPDICYSVQMQLHIFMFEGKLGKTDHKITLTSVCKMYHPI